MFAVFMVGYALLAVLSGSMSYGLDSFELLMISLLAFGIYYFIVGKPKVLLWTLVILLASISGLGLYLYRLELLYPFLEEVYAFLQLYYYSVEIEEYSIGILHQQLLIFVLGIILYRLIIMFYRSEKFKFSPPIAGFLIIIPSYLLGLFSSVKDRRAFYLLVFAAFIYYFEIYFVKSRISGGHQRRHSFYSLGIYMAIITLGISVLVNDNYQDPFKKKSVWHFSAEERSAGK